MKYWHLEKIMLIEKPDTKGHVLYDSIYIISRIDKPIETESRLVVARDWEEAGMSDLFNG